MLEFQSCDVTMSRAWAGGAWQHKVQEMWLQASSVLQFLVLPIHLYVCECQVVAPFDTLLIWEFTKYNYSMCFFWAKWQDAFSQDHIYITFRANSQTYLYIIRVIAVQARSYQTQQNSILLGWRHIMSLLNN